MSTYTAPLRDMQFILNEIAGLEEICALPGNEDCSVELVESILGILDRHRVKYTLNWIIAGLPFLTRPGTLTDAVSAAIGEVTGRQPEFSTTGGTSDGRFIAPTGAQVVELGVTNATIHKVNECARVADIEQLSAVYERVMERLLAGDR